MSGIFDRCIYTRTAVGRMHDAANGDGKLLLDHGARWTKARQWLHEARERDQDLLVMLSDGYDKNDVIYVGVAERIVVNERGTKAYLRGVRQLPTPLRITRVRRATNREPIAQNYSYPYACCITPDELLVAGPSVPTYLLAWNPRRDPWENFAQQAARTDRGAGIATRWSCGTTRNMPTGSRVYLMHLGKEPKGIIGVGRVTHAPFEDAQWDGQRRNHSEKSWLVGVRFEHLVAPGADEMIDLAQLKRISRATNWTPQASGIRLAGAVVGKLEALWTMQSADPAEADELTALEGEPKARMVMHRRREHRLRAAKIAAFLRAHARLVCEVRGCEFDFAATYGPLGAGYAQVHHLKPLAARVVSEKTRLSDLAIVCANCHAMVHKGGECRPLAGLIPRRRLVRGARDRPRPVGVRNQCR